MVAAAGTSVESAIVTSAVSVVVVPFVMGIGSVSAACGAASGVGSAMLYCRSDRGSVFSARQSRGCEVVGCVLAVRW